LLEINPGTPGQAAQDFDFGAVQMDGDGQLQVTFMDNKTLEWGAGSHSWFSPGFPLDVDYLGSFLDGNFDPISTAEFAGNTGDVSDIGGIDPPITLTELGEDGVFSGMLFQFAPFQVIDLDWVWEGSDTPHVGVSAIPIPAAV